MISEERRRQILETVDRERNISVEKLSRQFRMTVLTIRRDLEKLDKQCLLKKVHGGALAIRQILNEPIYNEQKVLFVEEKRRIAREAAKRIKNGSSVILESGTTCQALAKELYDKKDLKIICAAPNIANELVMISKQYGTNFKIISCGGVLEVASSIFIGPHAKRLFEEVKVDKVFLTATAIDLKEGITTVNPLEAELTQSVLACSRERIGLIDSSKFGKISLIKVAGVTVFDEIITDSGISKEMLKGLEKLKVKVTVV
ncbi:DeoR/GlpR transcriptional regulator [bacterium]|nr:DeoR/GlpR transcriptional regulator [bacterium]